MEFPLAEWGGSLRLKTFYSCLDTTDPFKRLRIWHNVLLHTVILYSKIIQIFKPGVDLDDDHWSLMLQRL